MYNYHKITIKGIVQGVGFRPFIYKISTQKGLKGYVKNNPDGVEVVVDTNDVEEFINILKSNLPPLAKITSIEKNVIKSKKFHTFKIYESDSVSAKTTLLSPDIAMCKKCETELLSQNSKRYNYPFINCTNCGPRYSIIYTLPYDRNNTAMKNFKLCKECKNDYNNPDSRMFHAQPIGCNKCGIELFLDGKKTDSKNAIKQTAQYIKMGSLIAIKGIGGFHIVCDATNEKSIQKLREAKNRLSKPFAVMCKNMHEISKIAKLTNEEIHHLKSKEKAIVILKKQKTSHISKLVAPNIDRIGCFLPYTPLQYLLFQYLDNPIIATSANISDEPIIVEAKNITKKLPFIEHILDYNRDIPNAIDDSLIQIVQKKLQILRPARGFAPTIIKLEKKLEKRVLALGANQKNTIAIAFDDNLILSPHIGDLNSIANFEFFENTLKSFQRFYDFEADVIIHDKHPAYETTKWAKKQNKELYEVQHHLAHIYATKAEFNLQGNFTGFSFDGTGYGDDGILWGGEIFVKDNRKYHFKAIKLLGGEKAIREPRRVALSMLFEKYTLDEVLKLHLPFTQQEIKVLHQSYIKNLNAPPTTSLGRIFDAVASFAKLCDFQTYEGEAGLLCEKAYDENIVESFDFHIKNSQIEIDFDFFDKDIVSKFINTIADIIVYISKKEALSVILSGGVFQNKTLLELTLKKLKRENIKHYHQQKTPINDAGIAIGQIYYYLNNIH